MDPIGRCECSSPGMTNSCFLLDARRLVSRCDESEQLCHLANESQESETETRANYLSCLSHLRVIICHKYPDREVLMVAERFPVPRGCCWRCFLDRKVMELSSLRSFRRKQLLKPVVPGGSLAVLLLKMGFFCEIRGQAVESYTSPGGRHHFCSGFWVVFSPNLSCIT